MKPVHPLIWIPLLSLFTRCASPDTSKPVSVPTGFDWQGHRGCRGLMPENSIPAFLKALEYEEIGTLELDLAVSADGQLIVSHEPWFNATICLGPAADSAVLDETTLIYQLTAAQIRQYDCGSKGNPKYPEQQKMPVYKPTLSELVDTVRAAFPEKNIRWNLEIKSKPDWDEKRTPAVDSFARLVVNAIHALDIKDACIVQSFDERALQAVRRLDPAIPIAQLIENIWGYDRNVKALGFKPDVYSPYHQLVNKSLVKKCREENVKLIPWTVNEVSDMRRLILLGVDGIITDYPNRIREVDAPE